MSNLSDQVVPPSAQASGSDRLRADLPLWGLLGYGILYVLGLAFVIPAPWTYPAYLRYVCRHVLLPDGQRLAFQGRAGERWYLFILLGLLTSLVEIRTHGAPSSVGTTEILDVILVGMLNFAVVRWFCARLGVEAGRLHLSFRGGFWPFLGWHVLAFIAAVTIIGWAWVLKYAWRWTCRNISGDLAVEFHAGGWDILWRSLACAIACVFIIPIPWATRWYLAWLISEVSVARARMPAG